MFVRLALVAGSSCDDFYGDECDDVHGDDLHDEDVAFGEHLISAILGC